MGLPVAITYKSTLSNKRHVVAKRGFALPYRRQKYYVDNISEGMLTALQRKDYKKLSMVLWQKRCMPIVLVADMLPELNNKYIRNISPIVNNILNEANNRYLILKIGENASETRFNKNLGLELKFHGDVMNMYLEVCTIYTTTNSHDATMSKIVGANYVYDLDKIRQDIVLRCQHDSFETRALPPMSDGQYDS